MSEPARPNKKCTLLQNLWNKNISISNMKKLILSSTTTTYTSC